MSDTVSFLVLSYHLTSYGRRALCHETDDTDRTLKYLHDPITTMSVIKKITRDTFLFRVLNNTGAY